MIGKPLFLDFTGEPPDPEWVIEGMFERGTLTVIAAAPSAGKSFLMASMATAVVQGKPWLGRQTYGRKVLYIDGENLPRIIRWRLAGLGMTNSDRDNIRYFLRAGVRIGEGDWLTKVCDEIQDFQPDLVVLDTATSVLAVKSGNDNSEVGLVMGMLRGMCALGPDKGCALVLLHHERKPPNDDKPQKNPGAAILGGIQWQGQADSHLSLQKSGKVEKKRLEDGGKRKRYRMKLEVPKNREGEDESEEWAIVSDHAANGKPIPGMTKVVRL